MAASLPVLGRLTVVGTGVGMPDPIQTSAGDRGGNWWVNRDKIHSIARRSEASLEPGRLSLCANRFHVCTGTVKSLQKADFCAPHLFSLSL